MYAARLAEKKGFKDVLILGATGNRLDHTLCNLGVLIKFFTNQIKAAILDDYSEICIAGSSPVTIDSKFKYFSVLAVTPVCRGVYIREAKYPLEDGVIKIENQYGISNEVLPGKSSSKVWVNDGLVMVIKDF